MKKRVNHKFVACGLTVALVLGGIFASPAITPPQKSDSLGILSIFSNNSGLSLIADAEEAPDTTETTEVTETTKAGENSAAEVTTEAENNTTSENNSIPEGSAEPDIDSIMRKAVNVDESTTSQEEGDIVLDESYLLIDNDGNTLNGFSREGKKKFNELIAQKGYKQVNITFKDTIKPRLISGNAFQSWTLDTGRNAFDNEGVTFNLTLPDSVEEIGMNAFVNNHISAIKFGSKIKKIGYQSFDSAGLKGKLELPEGLEELGWKSFVNNEITEVNFPDSLTKVAGFAFAENKINTINWGKYNVKGSIKDTDINEQSIIPCGLFDHNSLEHIDIPDKVVAIDYNAFSDNILEELTIKKNIRYIGGWAFEYNYIALTEFDRNVVEIMPGSVKRTIRKLTFEDGIELKEIKHNTFRASIEGIVEIPECITSIGHNAFSNNIITNLRIPSSKPAIGNNAFLRCPLESIENLNSTNLGYSVFNQLLFPREYDTSRTILKKLKNVSFDYQNLDNNFTYLPERFFINNLLKSINLPEQITTIEDNAFGIVINDPERDFVFLNPGWYNDNNIVALYRVGKDGKTPVMNDDLKDGEYYVVNPVLFNFNIKDQSGNPLSFASLPQGIKADITRNGNTTSYTDISTIDSTHFKLGDKVKLTISSSPNGYEFMGIAEQPGIVKISDTEYEINLDPTATNNVVKDESYDSSYNVGYKSATVELRYRTQSNGGSTPVVPVPETIPEPTPTPVTPDTPVVPTPATPDQPSVDVDDSETPQGDTDTTDIDDDTTPQGKTNTGKKVIADKTDEVNVNDEKTPRGTLPSTGGTNTSLLTLLGALLIGLGIIMKKKFK